LRFGVFEVDPEAGELRKQGVPIRLQEQPLRVLLALLNKPGEIVTREELCKSIWGDGYVGDADHGISAAVNRLRQVIGDSAEHPRYIETLSRRGYRLIAPVSVAAATTAQTTSAPRSAWLVRRTVTIAAVATAIAVTTTWFWVSRTKVQPPRPTVRRLTTLTGSEYFPAISRGGRLLAFSWGGERNDNRDLYVMVPGEANMLRLTDDPAVDTMPAWSPDDKQIAFVSTRDGGGIYVVSPLGGRCRKVADIPTDTPPAWSPDGRYIAVARLAATGSGNDGAVFVIAADGHSEPRMILNPPGGKWYRDVKLSPDGQQMAVALCAGPGPSARLCEVVVLPMDQDLKPVGPPRTVAPPTRNVTGLAWTPSADALFMSGSATTGGAGAAGNSTAANYYLWRIDLRNGAAPERLEPGGSNALQPATDGLGGVAFVRTTTHSDIWRWSGGYASPFLTSSVRDSIPRFSPDGRRVAFESNRGGTGIQIWVANADGTGLVQLTRDFSDHCGSPTWSPDGTRIAFDSYGSDGRWNVWVMGADGGHQHRLTQDGGDHAVPAWSRDGTVIYFFSNRSGLPQIWRAPAFGGPAKQVTRNGGYIAAESLDGKSLYFTKTATGEDGLWELSLSTGQQEKQIITEAIAARALEVTEAGICYLAEKRPEKTKGNREAPVADSILRRYEMRVWDLRTRLSRTIGEVDGPIHHGLTISPDGLTFLYSRVIPDSDIMLMENLQ
jgi:Tol biopolymer transport system component/DNA-binding winged helix-turn-helix (wHTH) protein